jgi:hypothetical protein
MWGNYWGNTPPQRYWTVSYWPMGGAAGEPAPVGSGGGQLLPLLGMGSSWLIGAILGAQALRLIAQRLTT